MGDQLLSAGLPCTRRTPRRRVPIYRAYLPPGFVLAAASKLPRARTLWRCEECGGVIPPAAPRAGETTARMHWRVTHSHRLSFDHVTQRVRNDLAREHGRVALRDVLEWFQMNTLRLVLGDHVARHVHNERETPGAWTADVDELEDLAERVRDADPAPAFPDNLRTAQVSCLGVLARLEQGAAVLRLIAATSVAWHLAVERTPLRPVKELVAGSFGELAR